MLSRTAHKSHAQLKNGVEYANGIQIKSETDENIYCLRMQMQMESQIGLNCFFRCVFLYALDDDVVSHTASWFARIIRSCCGRLLQSENLLLRRKWRMQEIRRQKASRGRRIRSQPSTFNKDQNIKARWNSNQLISRTSKLIRNTKKRALSTKWKIAYHLIELN